LLPPLLGLLRGLFTPPPLLCLLGGLGRLGTASRRLGLPPLFRLGGGAGAFLLLPLLKCRLLLPPLFLRLALLRLPLSSLKGRRLLLPSLLLLIGLLLFLLLPLLLLEKRLLLPTLFLVAPLLILPLLLLVCAERVGRVGIPVVVSAVRAKRHFEMLRPVMV
jgi:hypothetical protein